MEDWKRNIQKDLDNIKSEQQTMKTDILLLREKEIVQDQQISGIQETLKDIKDDTKWLRRSITNALIVALVGGAVAIFYATIKLNQ